MNRRNSLWKLCSQLGDLGFLGILISEEYGGAGLGYVEYALIVEELAKIDPSISLSVAAHNGLCTNHIYQFANEAQRKKYVPDLASGKKIGAWGLTESSSGSDAAGLKSTAQKNGQQIYFKWKQKLHHSRRCWRNLCCHGNYR